MKYIILICISLFFNDENELDKLRKGVSYSSNEQYIENCLSIAKTNDVYKLYEGLYLTMIADHKFLPTTKYEYFSKGKSILDSLIETTPYNVEYRYTRVIVQLNTPDFLFYNNIDDDIIIFSKNIIESNYSLSFKKFMIENILSQEKIKNSHTLILSDIYKNL